MDDRKLSPEQQAALDIVTNRYFDKDEWISGRELRGEVAGATRDDRQALIQSLVPRYICEATSEAQDFYGPTLEGALVSGRGARFRTYIRVFLAVLRQKFEVDRTFRRISEKELKDEAERIEKPFDENDVIALDRLLARAEIAHQARQDENGIAWRTPDDIEELVEINNAEALLALRRRQPVIETQDMVAGPTETGETVSASKMEPDTSALEPGKVTIGQLFRLATRLRLDTASALLGTLVAMLGAAGAVGYWARGVQDAARPPAKAQVGRTTTAPASSSLGARHAALLPQTSTVSKPAPPRSSAPTTPTPAAKKDADCARPLPPPPPKAKEAYCIEIARAETPQIDSSSVMAVAEEAHRMLGIYWRGSPPAKARPVEPIKGGSYDSVPAARWYAVSKKIGDSVCLFLRCEGWSGTENQVDKVCTVLPKAKCK